MSTLWRSHWERGTTAPRTAPGWIGRLAGAVVAAALVVLGLALATRPVSDQALGAHATATTTGTVLATRPTFDRSQLLTVAWHTGNGQQARGQLLYYYVWPAWEPGDQLEISFDPRHPAGDAVAARPTWTFAADFRADAVFQAIVPLTLAGIVLALWVIWPAGPMLFGDSARRARRSLHGYVLAPALIGGLLVAAAAVIQDQAISAMRGVWTLTATATPSLVTARCTCPGASAYSSGPGKIVGWLSVVLMLLLIWPCLRAVQYYRLRELLTVREDAADNAARVTSVASRKLRLGDMQMVVLTGQSSRAFRAGQTVRIYGRWKRRGPAVITDGEMLVIGFARRLAPALRSRADTDG